MVGFGSSSAHGWWKARDPGPVEGVRRYSGTCPTRLETRTKESDARASRRVFTKPHGAVKARGSLRAEGEISFLREEGERIADPAIVALSTVPEYECERRDPIDGDLRLSRAKPGETLVEARSDSDVQIDRPTRA